MAEETLQYKGEFDGTQILATLKTIDDRFAQMDRNTQAAFANLQKSSESGFSVFKGVLQERIFEKIGEGIKEAFSKGAEFIKSSVELAHEHHQTMLLVEASIEATGNAAGVTAKQMNELAISLSKQTDESREQILAAESLALHYSNISGKEIPALMQASLDLAKVSGGEAKESMRALAIAMQDPEAGMTRLRRVGVLFTDQQKEQAKALTNAGNILAAHKIMLDGIEAAYGHIAQRAADPLLQMKNAWEQIKISVGEQLLPVLADAANAVKAVMVEFEESGKAKDLLEKIAEAGQIVEASLRGVFQVLKNGQTDVDAAGGALDSLNFILKTMGSILINVTMGLREIPIILHGIKTGGMDAFEQMNDDLSRLEENAEKARAKLWEIHQQHGASGSWADETPTTEKPHNPGMSKEQTDRVKELHKTVLDSATTLEKALAELDASQYEKSLSNIEAERAAVERKYNNELKDANTSAAAIVELKKWRTNMLASLDAQEEATNIEQFNREFDAYSAHQQKIMDLDVQIKDNKLEVSGEVYALQYQQAQEWADAQAQTIRDQELAWEDAGISRIDAEAWAAAEILKIDELLAGKQKKIAKDTANAELQARLAGMSSVISASEGFVQTIAGHNKALFAISKALAAADIAVHGEMAIAQIHATTPPVLWPELEAYARISETIQLATVAATVVQGFAAGTNSAPPGMAWVGERGPELVDFGGGERVYPHETSVAMARNTFNNSASISIGAIHIHGSGLSQSQLTEAVTEGVLSAKGTMERNRDAEFMNDGTFG